MTLTQANNRDYAGRVSTEMSGEESQTEYTMRLLREEWLDREKDRLDLEVSQFDPSDDYHEGDWSVDDDFRALQEEGYYAAIDRVMNLLRGDITTWTDPKPEKKEPTDG